jgi:Tetracyclin repressor-like, C-terminal domain
VQRTDAGRLTDPFPDLAAGREGACGDQIAAALIITAGLWPIANPAPRVTAIYDADPALTRAHVDFEVRLQQLLSSLITGFLNPETPDGG